MQDNFDFEKKTIFARLLLHVLFRHDVYRNHRMIADCVVLKLTEDLLVILTLCSLFHSTLTARLISEEQASKTMEKARLILIDHS